MYVQIQSKPSARSCGRLLMSALLCLAGSLLIPISASLASPDGAAGPERFESVEAAAKALIEAARANDDAALLAIWGPGCEDITREGKDPGVARERRELAVRAVQLEGADPRMSAPTPGRCRSPAPSAR